MRWHCFMLLFFLGANCAVSLQWRQFPQHSNGPSVETNDHSWDVLIFTQSWPATVCRDWKDKNPSHSCALPQDKDMWTIHGIWPTKLHTMGPVFCNRTWHFDQKLIQPIENELENSWKNIEAETSTYSLWAHEWTKHGTCAAVLEPLNSEFKYFSQGLEWHKKINIKEILESHKVYPSKDQPYKVLDFYNNLRSALGTNPDIRCKKENGTSWLQEIRVCFDKSLSLTNCDGIMDATRRVVHFGNNPFFFPVLTNCDVHEPIFYPTNDVAENPVVRLYPRSSAHLYTQLYNSIAWLQWFTL